MPRPRTDGTPASPPNRRKITDRYVRSIVPDPSRSIVLTWDAQQPAFVLAAARARTRGRADAMVGNYTHKPNSSCRPLLELMRGI